MDLYLFVICRPMSRSEDSFRFLRKFGRRETSYGKVLRRKTWEVLEAWYTRLVAWKMRKRWTESRHTQFDKRVSNRSVNRNDLSKRPIGRYITNKTWECNSTDSIIVLVQLFSTTVRSYRPESHPIAKIRFVNFVKFLTSKIRRFSFVAPVKYSVCTSWFRASRVN